MHADITLIQELRVPKEYEAGRYHSPEGYVVILPPFSKQIRCAIVVRKFLSRLIIQTARTPFSLGYPRGWLEEAHPLLGSPFLAFPYL